MKQRIQVTECELECWTSAEAVIRQLQAALAKYGAGNVDVESYTPAYENTSRHIIVAYREETDEEYETRLAKEKATRDTVRQRELKQLAELKAKYETLDECAKDDL